MTPFNFFFQNRREHEEICPFKPVQCPEFDCSVTRPMNEIFKHFRHQQHFTFPLSQPRLTKLIKDTQFKKILESAATF